MVVVVCACECVCVWGGGGEGLRGTIVAALRGVVCL